MKKQTGFTLIELMVTVAIVGILLTVGLPQLKTFTQGSQLVASTNELLSAFHLARSEAIKLNTRVSICESNNRVSCTATGWEDGWIVFVDGNGEPPGDLVNTGAACSENTATDCLLRIHEGFTDDLLTVSAVDAGNAVVSSFTFTSRGLPKAENGAAESGVFSICTFDSSNNVLDSRAVVLSLSGRVRISDNEGVVSCVAP